jgi:hypothetical protein
MAIYRLTPSARADDPNWDNSFNHGEVVVRAHSTGEARAIAALEEASQYSGGVPRVTTQVQASGFKRENLYSVVLDTSREFAEDGPVCVLSGTFTFPDNLAVSKQA